LGQEQLLVGVRLSIAVQDQNPTIGGRHPHIDYLHRDEFLQRRAQSQSGSQGLEPIPQGDLQAVGDEGHEDVGLDALVGLMVDGANGEVAFLLLRRPARPR